LSFPLSLYGQGPLGQRFLLSKPHLLAVRCSVPRSGHVVIGELYLLPQQCDSLFSQHAYRLTQYMNGLPRIIFPLPPNISVVLVCLSRHDSVVELQELDNHRYEPTGSRHQASSHGTCGVCVCDLLGFIQLFLNIKGEGKDAAHSGVTVEKEEQRTKTGQEMWERCEISCAEP